MGEVNMLAPCGIDCSGCEIHRAARDPELAEQVAARWRETWLPDAQADWLKCQGCRADRSLCWCDDCGIYKCCVQDKGLTYCSECAGFPCEQLSKWREAPAHHQAALERLKEMASGSG